MMLGKVEKTGSSKYVLPVIILKTKNTITEECRMCGRDILYKKQYYYTSPLSNTKLTICKPCAIREYYGTRGKATRNYKRHSKRKRMFGIEGND